jgi:hypothetical protein
VNPQEAFLEMLVAAMADAAVETKLTQLKTQIDPDGKGIRHVRLIVIPEEMDFTFSPPLGTSDA